MDNINEVDAAELRQDYIDATATEAVTTELNRGLFFLRMAAVLNTVAMAMQQGGEVHWTDAHAESVCKMMDEASKHVMTEDPGIVPGGFGQAVMTKQAMLMVQAAAKLGLPRKEPQ